MRAAGAALESGESLPHAFSAPKHEFRRAKNERKSRASGNRRADSAIDEAQRTPASMSMQERAGMHDARAGSPRHVCTIDAAARYVPGTVVRVSFHSCIFAFVHFVHSS